MDQPLGSENQTRDQFEQQLLEQIDPALRFAIRLTGNVCDGEDLIQESILRAINRRYQWRQEGSIKSWFFQIVVNTFKNRTKKAKLEGALTGHEESNGRAPIDLQLSTELGDQIAKAISQLPPMQRQVLILITYELFSPSDTAQILQISTQNVYSHLHNARTRLKHQLQRYFEDEDPI